MADCRRLRLEVEGIVQGVGFRPFLHRLAERYGLSGWARNTSAGVELEIEGIASALEDFVTALEREAPPLAVIDRIARTELPCAGGEGFRILPSAGLPRRQTLVSPDVGVCPDCLRELRDPSDRRHRYAFLNCTNCGPRFTIVRDLPYDRPRTAMAAFPMCPDCRSEYDDINDRRYHAQPTCCPDCGPTLAYLDGAGRPLLVDRDPIALAQRALRAGDIVAVKGLGGFHLACLPTPEAVDALRQRKGREEKPFALMCADLDAARAVCEVSDAEAARLESWRRPIVLLRKKSCAPAGLSDNRDLGLMLPYTPLHYLLMEGFPLLVMTSANPTDLPAVISNEAAVAQLAGIADGFLLHDRDIVTRCDDSLIRVFEGADYPLRRSRGYAPQPLTLSFAADGILACGAEQKASFCLGRDNLAFPSQHIGDLKNAQTLAHYEGQISHFEALFGVQPALLACDAHPDYLSTQYARQRAKSEGLPLVEVQHHHAHMAACMADNRLTGPCIGLIWDGTGYGEDGTIWGGECLVGDAAAVRRTGSLRPLPLPGGDLCAREIDRTAHALLWDAGLTDRSPLPPARRAQLDRQLNAGLNCPRSSGMGRLFDGVYALLTRRATVTYEGQGAILLEAMAEQSCARRLPVSFYEEDGLLRLDTRPMAAALLDGLDRGDDPAELAAAFMNALVDAGTAQCAAAREATGVNDVVLSGGVFQNMYLLPRLLAALRSNRFRACHHTRVSPNDEGICLGQLTVAAARRKDVV